MTLGVGVNLKIKSVFSISPYIVSSAQLQQFNVCEAFVPLFYLFSHNSVEKTSEGVFWLNFQGSYHHVGEVSAHNKTGGRPFMIINLENELF